MNGVTACLNLHSVQIYRSEKKVKFSEYEATAAKITASMEAKNKTRRKTSVFTVYV